MRSRAIYLFSCLLLVAAPVAGQMPDFVQLMRAEGRAVVNVSTTFYQGGDASDVPLSDTPQEELLREFLRRQLEPYAPRDFESRSLGSGFLIAGAGKGATVALLIERAGGQLFVALRVPD